MTHLFPLVEGAPPAQIGQRALAAAQEAIAAVSALAPLRIGLALHVGELAYGNIGSANRLDFTAIGAAVNLTARLEGVCSFRGVPLVVSEELAQLAGIETEDLGTFELKGIAARSACWRRAEVRGAHDPRNRARQSRSCPNST